MYVLGAANATLAFPSDGLGGISTVRTGGTATGATTFTATTVTDAGPWALTNVVAGDYVTVSTGEWGVVQSKSGATVTVDKWHFAIKGQYGPTTRTPATGASNVVIYGPNICAGASEILIGNITFPNSTAAQTFSITDPFGTAIITLTVGAAGTSTQPFFGESGLGNGLPLDRPFGIKCSSTGIIPLVQFAIVK